MLPKLSGLGEENHTFSADVAYGQVRRKGGGVRGVWA
jgi:hypothetical protein